MRFISRLQPLEDIDGLRLRRLGHVHRLEAPLEGGVLLDVTAVLGHGRRANALQAPPRERRLEQVGCVDRPVGSTRADERVDLVNEEHRVVRRSHFVDDLLQPLLELAAVLGVGDEQPQLERDEPFAEQSRRHPLLYDCLRECLSDCCLANAGVADEHRIRLASAHKNLQATPDFGIAADHGIELAIACLLRQVDRALRERCVLLRAAAAADQRPLAALDALGEAGTLDTELHEHLARSGTLATVEHRKHERLRRDEIAIRR
mmetsp:Transcript_5636/g.13061  ORF Transcript_5636/g.13061 Transcript_5636/m.13061 type:complete len:262 (-) Transcript_5636:541-1326(-)